jgi:hypothetical protein
MKVGAKVPVAGVLLRCEFERIRVELFLDGKGPDVKGEKDWWRWWPTPDGGESGDVNIVDLGRPLALLLGVATGEGEAEALLKGLVLHLGPLWPGAAMSSVLSGGVNSEASS